MKHWKSFSLCAGNRLLTSTLTRQFTTRDEHQNRLIPIHLLSWYSFLVLSPSFYPVKFLPPKNHQLLPDNASCHLDNCPITKLEKSTCSRLLKVHTRKETRSYVYSTTYTVLCKSRIKNLYPGRGCSVTRKYTFCT